MKARRPILIAAGVIAVGIPAWFIHTWWFSPERQARILVHAIVTGNSRTLAGMTMGRFAEPRLITDRQLEAVLPIALGVSHTARMGSTQKSDTRFVVIVAFDGETKRGKPVNVTIPLYHTPRGWLVEDAELIMGLVGQREDYRERWEQIAKAMTAEGIPMIPYYRIGQGLTPTSITRYLADERGTALDPMDRPNWTW